MEQAFIDNYRYLARYNRWFNQNLFATCGKLSDEERKRERGAFFGSIHNTLNHIVWGDCLWLQRFARQGVAFASLPENLLSLPPGAVHATVLFEDWAALCERRERLDVAIEGWIAEMPQEYPLLTMRYANSKGVQREHPVWKAMTHFFNHQTHHRGQATTLLMQAGVDPGTTDLIALA
ncbi:MAG: DinB family protein [Burkholderiales bacterium]|nr:DinB family protein [Burkholderiales bacterium]